MSDEITENGSERDWLGPKNECKHVIYQAQRPSTEERWYLSDDLLELDPDYSEFSVRIHDPRCRSLSFIHRTLAILPKSKLKTVHKLISEYLRMSHDVSCECVHACVHCTGECDQFERGDDYDDDDDNPRICATCHRWDLGHCDTDPGDSCDDWTIQVEY